jgi:hypothetical protein
MFVKHPKGFILNLRQMTVIEPKEDKQIVCYGQGEDRWVFYYGCAELRDRVFDMWCSELGLEIEYPLSEINRSLERIVQELQSINSYGVRIQEKR